MVQGTESLQARRERLDQKAMRIITVFLVCLVILVGFHQYTKGPNTGVADKGAILTERMVYLWGDTKGAARITDADGGVIAEYEAGKGGFVSTIDRVVRRQRLVRKATADAPVLVRLREGNRVSLFDPETGLEADLMSYGKDNVAKFASLVTGL